MDVNSGLDSLFAEFHLFTMPAVIIIVGLGFSILSSCGSKTRKTLEMHLEETTLAESAEIYTLSPVSNVDESLSAVENEDDILLETNSAENLDSSVDFDNNKIDDSPTLDCSMMWLENQGPAPRIGGCALFDSGLGLFTVVGGMADDKLFSDVHVFAADENEWTDYSREMPNSVHDEGFEERQGFVYGSVGMLSDYMILFGGINEIRSVNNFTHFYNFDRRIWEKMPLLTSAQPRGRFNATLISWRNNDNLILFGGHDGTNCLNDVWKLSIVNNKAMWTELYSNQDFSSIPEEGDDEGDEVSEYVHAPMCREAHATVVLHDKMIIFGGNSVNGDYISNCEGLLEVFDLNHAVWNLYITSGEGPSRVAGGGSAQSIQSSNTIIVISRDQHLSFFNDIYFIDVTPLFRTNHNSVSCDVSTSATMFWRRISPNWIGDPTMPPSSRVYFSAALDECEGQLYIFGGQNLTYENPVLSETSDVIILEPDTVLIDVSKLLNLTEDEYNNSENAESSEDFKKYSIPIPMEERDIEFEVTEDKILSDRNITPEVDRYLNKIFGDIEDMRRSNPFFSNVENETLEDFLKIRDQIDLKFAEKYLSESEIMAIKSKFPASNVDNCNSSGKLNNLRSTCPLPRQMLS